MNIGFLGLGAMGGALAGRLVGQGALTVYDLNDAAMQSFEARGATLAETAADLARACDVVVLCLPRSSIVRQAIFGPDGLAEGLSPGKLVIDQTSGVPAQTREIAGRLAELGVDFVDAPVAGGVPAAEQGSILVMASGPDAAYDRALPCLRLMTPNVLRSGRRVGDGHAMKLVNNAINGIVRIGTFEIVAAGRKQGLSLQAITDRLNGGHGIGRMSMVVLKSILERKPSSKFALSLMLKDMNETLSLAGECGAPLPLVAIARGIMQIGVNTLGDDAQLEDLAALSETLAGVRLLDEDDAPAGDVQDQASLLDAIDAAVAACNRLAALECTTMGLRYGLSAENMLGVIVRGSAWSKAAEEVAGDPAAAEAGQRLDGSLGALRVVAGVATDRGAPIVVANAVRSTLEAAANVLGTDAPVHRLGGLYRAAAGLPPPATSA